MTESVHAPTSTVEVAGRTVHRVGYGAMRLVGQPGNWGRPRDAESSYRVLRECRELGVDFLDTADAYGPGVSEDLIAEALWPYSPDLVVATKGGRVKTGPAHSYSDASPAHLREACEASLRRLRVDHVPLYQLHLVDPEVPLEDSVGALAELRAEGKIGGVGLSNVGVEEIDRAQRITPVAAVQNRFNVAERESEPVVDRCEADGIAFIAYAPLAARPFEPHAPLVPEDGVDAAPGADDAVARVARVAAEQGASPAQVAIAWLLARSPAVLPIVGTTRIDRLRSLVGASHLVLTPDQMSAL